MPVPPRKQDKGGGSHKYGRNKAKCETYRWRKGDVNGGPKAGPRKNLG